MLHGMKGWIAGKSKCPSETRLRSTSIRCSQLLTGLFVHNLPDGDIPTNAQQTAKLSMLIEQGCLQSIQ